MVRWGLCFFVPTWHALGVTTNTPGRPRLSGRQAGRLLLPHWLRDGAHELLRVEFAIGVGRPEAAVAPGRDVDDRVLSLVSEATPELRAACRRFLMGYAFAPHSKWEAPPIEEEPDDTPAPSIADLERQLRELAESGDRGAILALLAALDPARYGPPGKVAPPADSSVDVVDFTPAIVTATK